MGFAKRPPSNARALLKRYFAGEREFAGAHLSGANLSGANLRAANLNGASLRGAAFNHTALVGTDLTVIAKIPDLETIADIPYRIFDLLARRTFLIAPVFISYSWDNDVFVDRLGESLRKAGVRCWRDKHDATAGPLDRVIDAGMSMQSVVILVLSESSVSSPWVEYEVDNAVQLARERRAHMLCPIALDDAWTSALMSGHLQTQIRKYNVLDMSGWQDEETFDRQLRRLLEGLEAHYPPATPVKPDS